MPLPWPTGAAVLLSRGSSLRRESVNRAAAAFDSVPTLRVKAVLSRLRATPSICPWLPRPLISIGRGMLDLTLLHSGSKGWLRFAGWGSSRVVMGHGARQARNGHEVRTLKHQGVQSGLTV